MPTFRPWKVCLQTFKKIKIKSWWFYLCIETYRDTNVNKLMSRPGGTTVSQLAFCGKIGLSWDMQVFNKVQKCKILCSLWKFQYEHHMYLLLYLFQSGCDKVYISTSDVQMHANYHRKDSAIIQEGFQRFRATEDCGTTTCSFYGQRTTHFHCRRSNCNFTFKNKADMGQWYNNSNRSYS